MGAGVVEVTHVDFRHASQVLFAHEQKMIQTLTPDTAKEEFDTRVRTRGVVRRAQDLNARSHSGPVEGGAILAIVIVDTAADI
jgi:hypothetical protein